MIQDIIKLLTSIASSSGCIFLLYYGISFYTIKTICKHPELSDEKVKHITRMIAKDKTHI